jgi:hypothetical protein
VRIRYCHRWHSGCAQGARSSDESFAAAPAINATLPKPEIVEPKRAVATAENDWDTF